jgi:DNA-directed RNA polymerase specialized sigma24 family protein
VSTEEAARMLGISQGIARQRLHGARLAMAPLLGRGEPCVLR